MTMTMIMIMIMMMMTVMENDVIMSMNIGKANAADYDIAEGVVHFKWILETGPSPSSGSITFLLGNKL